MSEKRKKTRRSVDRASTQEKKKRVRVNLREERMKRSFSLQDISIRTNIPLPFLEALETGIVPQNLRGKKLGRYKQRYLEFLGFPIDAKLRFKMKQPKYDRTQSQRTRTISQKIEQPSTIKAMVTGIALAGAMIGVLKIVSQFLEQEPMIALNSPKADSPNETEDKTPPVKIAEQNTPMKEIQASASAVGSISPLLSPALVNADEIPEEEQFQNALHVEANDRTRVEVLCDGKILAAKRLEPSDRVVCRYNKEASVFVRDISRVKIENNERVIHPMGPLSKGRRLVFRN